MKIVRNPNRWLKKLSRAAALISVAMGSQAAFSQDGPFSFGRTPTGSASEIIDSNRDGFGVSFRGGHMAGDTVGRADSITHIGLMPYINIEDGMFFGDSRLLRGNDGGLVWSFGSGYRHYIADWDVVLGGNGYFDRDQLTGAHLKQWGVGAELLAHRWEARGNIYETFGSTSDLVGQGIKQNSAAFAGNNITFTRVDSFAEALRGFDTEAGALLPGDISERFDLRVFGGGYYYEGANIEGFAGWSSRLQAEIGKWLELGLKLTDDQRFDTTVMFTAAVQIGGFSSDEHTQRSAIQRFREPVRRNMNIVTLLSDTDVPGQIAQKADGTPFTIAHVNSNATGPAFLGTVDDPFKLLTQGLGAGTDIVFTHAGSRFDVAPENIVSLLPDQQLLGEGLIQAGRNVESEVPLTLLGPAFKLALPSSPSFAANPALTRPILVGAAGNGVTMDNGSTLSGFIIDSAALNGIFSDGKSDVLINDSSIVDAGLSGILLQNTAGQTSIADTSVESTVSGAASIHVNGGNGQISYVSTDDFLLGAITNSSPNESLLIENMTGGQFFMSRSSITDDGGLGVVIRNNTGGTATIDNVTSTNGTATGIAVLDSAGDYVFRKSNPRLTAITIQNSAQQGILLNNASGDITFTDNVLVLDRQTGGIEIANSSGTVRFSNPVTVNNYVGVGTEAAIFVHDQLAGSDVTFADDVIIGVGGAVPAAISSNGSGLQVFNNAAGSEFQIQGNTTVNLTNQASILIDTNNGDASFHGPTTITNRLLEGIIVNLSGGTTTFGDASADITLVQNQLNSQAAAIQITANPGDTRFSNVVVENAQGNPGRGAGIDIVGNTGRVRFTDLEVESLGGIGIFGLNNFEISTDDGTVDTQGAAAINIEESGINIHLETVDSSGSPDYGIRLVETNKPQKHTFLLKPNNINPIPGSGGIITTAKGNGLDDNDAAGIYLSNAGQVTITDVILDNNEFGVRIDNTEVAGATVADNDEQFFTLVDSQVIDSDIRGIFAQDLMSLSVLNTDFDNNGDDAANARETIQLAYSVNPDLDPAVTGATSPVTYGRADRPFEVLIQESGFVSNSEDVIRIFQNAAAAQGAVIRTRIFGNDFEVNDTFDPTVLNPVDTRPLFDDAIVIDWFGASRFQIDNNVSFDMQAVAQQHAIEIRNSTTVGLTEISIQNNDIVVANLGTDAGTVIVDLFGPAFMNDNLLQVAGNTVRMSGVTPTAFFFSLRGLSEVSLFSNAIRSESDGGTGIEIRRAANGSFFAFDSNIVQFRDLGAQDERGFIFTQVTGTVGLAGTQNVMQVISNGVNGNNFIEVPFAIPFNSNIGQVEINGVLFP